MDCSVSNVGDKLQVGIIPTDFPGLGQKLVPGTAVINGPVYIGAAFQGGVPSAACMIGPPMALSLPFSLDVRGISNFVGVTNTAGVIVDTAFTNKLGFISKLGAEVQQSIKVIFGLKTNNAVQITHGPKVCSAVATTPLIRADVGIFGTCTAALGTFKAVAAPFKKFDIPHPTKKGHRLVHTCLEGPEIGVYYRGKLKDSSTIELPEYWRGLVDSETITVHLTPCTYPQDLYVKSIEWGTRINIINNLGGQIDCNYIVYGERKDVPKLEVEPKEELDINYPETVR